MAEDESVIQLFGAMCLAFAGAMMALAGNPWAALIVGWSCGVLSAFAFVAFVHWRLYAKP